MSRWRYGVHALLSKVEVRQRFRRSLPTHSDQTHAVISKDNFPRIAIVEEGFGFPTQDFEFPEVVRELE